MEELKMRVINKVNGGDDCGWTGAAYCADCKTTLWTMEEYNEHKAKGHKVSMNSFSVHA